jgi:Na+-driven multidrug efflux pump
LPAVGFGFGAMAMMGQNIGAGNLERSQQSFRQGLLYASVSATALGIIVALFARFVIGIFTTDPIVTQYATYYMWTVALTYGFLAASLVEASAFQAIGRSWPGFWIVFLRFVIIAIPLAYILTYVFNFPIISVWLSLVAGNIVSAIVGYFWITYKLNKLDVKQVPVHT